MNDMPLIPRSNYVVMDRGRLRKLHWMQRFSCINCDYANGLIAWVKAVINVTEVYSCAIKHASLRHQEEHQKEYFAHEEFR